MRMFVLFLAVLMMPAMTLAANKMVTEDMQKCTTNADCTLVSEDCTKACASVPVNVTSAATIMQQMDKTCPAPMASLPKCTMNPPLSAACVNNRCTIGTAYDMNGSQDDYTNKLKPQ